VSNKEIEKLVESSESTISRELKRKMGQRGYRPRQAHNKALQRKRNATKTIKMTAEVIALVEEQIRLDLSPDQVSGWLKQWHGIELSHERIDQHILSRLACWR
jgi:transposase, IS30 family